jgi:hypothetical protein
MTSTLIPKDPPRGNQESRKPEPETYPKSNLVGSTVPCARGVWVGRRLRYRGRRGWLSDISSCDNVSYSLNDGTPGIAGLKQTSNFAIESVNICAASDERSSQAGAGGLQHGVSPAEVAARTIKVSKLCREFSVFCSERANHVVATSSVQDFHAPLQEVQSWLSQ